MKTMKEYIKENYSDDIENWESMTPREKLSEYLYNELGLDFGDDFFEVETVEQCISGCKRGLDNPEFKDMKNDIIDTINSLGKYKDKGLFCKFATDKDSCLFGQVYTIFTSGYDYIDYVRVI